MCQCPRCGAELGLMMQAQVMQAARDRQERPRRRDDRPSGGNPPPQPMTMERAAAFRMPFGKYKDMTLAEIDERDPEYLKWGVMQFDRAVGRAVKFYVEHRR